MTEIFNYKNRTKLRKKLRNNAPSAEKVLWKRLKCKQINDYKFRRQYGIGKFIVDFYCPRLKLVIEIDGANHFFDQKSDEYDKKRQKYIESLSIKVLRFTNTDIFYNLNGVLNVIYEETSPQP